MEGMMMTETKLTLDRIERAYQRHIAAGGIVGPHLFALRSSAYAHEFFTELDELLIEQIEITPGKMETDIWNATPSNRKLLHSV
jgi:hypothetical protein